MANAGVVTRAGLALTALFMAVCHGPNSFAQAFVPEPVGQVAELPSTYPVDWLVVHDLAFNHMREGKFFLMDPGGAGMGEQVKGLLSGDFIASFLHSARRNEFYVIESFHARGGRGGERTDVVTIYEPATLAVLDEVIIPAKRLTGLPNRYQVALIGADRWLLVYNFTPSQSVSVVDLEQRVVVGEIPIPGCAFMYPTGTSSFSSLCSDGAMRTTTLGADGTMTGSARTEPFIDIANDAAFEKPAMVAGVGYFPTFTGNVIPVDLSGEQARPGASWSLTSAEERAQGWRPGGAWPAIAGREGQLFVLMHSDGEEGTHKNGGDEVWVFDPASEERIGRFKLRQWGIALSMSGAAKTTLVVSGAEGAVDLYTADGEYLQTLALEAQTPLLVHGLN